MIENISIYFNDRNTTQIVIDKKSKDDYQMEVYAGSGGDYLFHFSREQLELIRTEINRSLLIESLIDDNKSSDMLRETQDYKDSVKNNY